MKRRSIVSLGAALLLALASPSHAAAPLTVERHQAAAQRVAVPYPNVNGRTMCVCQDQDAPAQTFFGYLNSYQSSDAGFLTVNMVCTFPVFTPGVATFGFCSIFQVIK